MGIVVIEIDGTMGEGGGQLVRAALALSLATGTPFRVTNLRAKRSKPGLLRQHLTGVLAAATLSDARVEGAELGSLRLSFAPRQLRGGTHEFAVGTAGSTLLVLQALLPALLVAPEPTRLALSGGTHNSAAPPFEFFARTLLPLLARCGARVAARLLRHGFYPAGGGRLEVEVEPIEAGAVRPLALHVRGALTARSARVATANLPWSIARTELAVVRAELGFGEAECGEERVVAHGPGNVLLLEFVHGEQREVLAGFGERGKPAAQVAAEAVAAARRWLARAEPVGEHLADQLLVPLALLGGGCFRTGPLSLHATTALEVVNRFLPGAIAVSCDPAGGCVVRVVGRAAAARAAVE